MESLGNHMSPLPPHHPCEYTYKLLWQSIKGCYSFNHVQDRILNQRARKFELKFENNGTSLPRLINSSNFSYQFHCACT